VAAVALHAQSDPLLKGYVTRSGTARDFDVNGIHILCEQTTLTQTIVNGSMIGRPECRLHPFGERLAIYGKTDRHLVNIEATEIAPDELSASSAVSGLALIDLILSPDMFRADGYAIRTTTETKITRAAPLTSSSSPAAGQWVEYQGKFGPDGAVLVSRLVFHAPAVGAKEQKFREKDEYDPSTVTNEDRQDPILKLIAGPDVKRIPAVDDPAQQARIERIGRQLIPGVQSRLAVDDPNKVNFRFQLIGSKWNYAVGLPSGIILVPATLPGRLEDDQLAAVLAYAVAGVLEKQAYRFRPPAKSLQALSAAAFALDMLNPISAGLAGAGAIGAAASGSAVQRDLDQQRARMGLVLMYDAGFNLDQAPMVWWRLSTRKSDYMKDPPPARSAYLFQTLSLEWNPASPLRVGAASKQSENLNAATASVPIH